MSERQSTGELINKLAMEQAGEIMVAQSQGAKFPIEDGVRNALLAFHDTQFPGCRACGDEGYHTSRASMLAELIKDFKEKSGRLFADEQDKEAQYLREYIIKPFKVLHEVEMKHAAKFADGFHTCTLTGLHP
jgi:hypothetical protein